MNDTVRQSLERLVRERGESYAGLSVLLKRNPAYIQQFIKRGSPRRLEDKDRQTLARYFRVDEELLGEPSPSVSDQTVRVPRLAVRASAGSGAVVDGEFLIGAFNFDEGWLRAKCHAKPEDLSIIQVTGDSMIPTLNDGDDVLVDRSDTLRRIRDGIYVLRRDDTLMVKRLALVPTSQTLTIISDNPAYPSFLDCPLVGINVIGRVVWAGRSLG